MQTIQVVLDEKLAVREKERRDREGHLRQPHDAAEMAVWDRVLEWPED